MSNSFFLVLRNNWALCTPANEKRIAQNLFPLGAPIEQLRPRCRLLLRMRSSSGLHLDSDAQIVELGQQYYLRSTLLAGAIESLRTAEFTALHFEGTPDNALCTIQPLPDSLISEIESVQPSLRLEAFDLPPRQATVVDNREITTAFLTTFRAVDPDLYAQHVVRFLESPHILVQLFEHAMSLRSDDSPDFVVTLRKIADQLRHVIENHSGAIRFTRIVKSHANTWAEAQGRRIAFLDGGIARVPNLARQEPLALRVGTYSVVPGETDLSSREHWQMQSFLLSDCIDKSFGRSEQTNRRRLVEAAQYTFELLAARKVASSAPDTSALLIHGPLVNQFTQYDEVAPNFIPPLSAEFLATYGISKEGVQTELRHMPDKPGSSEPFWHHFMAIYAYLAKAIFNTQVPIAGIVERAASRPVANAILSTLVSEGAIESRYVERLQHLMDKFDITDELLFGCILQEGEYLSPVPIAKAAGHRSREHWQPVVAQLPRPFATMLKTDSSSFPFRIEMNQAAFISASWVMRLVYHTARLLPRYAFPVGLDIADKYAKVPDWISKGVSLELSSFVLRRALRTGDPHLVAQVRRLLSTSPRDFFFRPRADF